MLNARAYYGERGPSVYMCFFLQVASTRHTAMPEGGQAERVREMLHREATLQVQGSRMGKLPPGTTPPGQLQQHTPGGSGGRQGGRGGRRGTPNSGGVARIGFVNSMEGNSHHICCWNVHSLVLLAATWLLLWQRYRCPHTRTSRCAS